MERERERDHSIFCAEPSLPCKATLSANFLFVITVGACLAFLLPEHGFGDYMRLASFRLGGGSGDLAFVLAKQQDSKQK